MTKWTHVNFIVNPHPDYSPALPFGLVAGQRMSLYVPCGVDKAVTFATAAHIAAKAYGIAASNFRIGYYTPKES